MDRTTTPSEDAASVPTRAPIPASRRIGAIGTVAVALAFGLAACDATPASPSAPGGWQWFRAVAPAEREAYYERRCAGLSERAQCVMNRLLRQSVDTCRMELGSEKDEVGDAALRRQRARVEACARALLAPHGVLALDPDLEGYPDL